MLWFYITMVLWITQAQSHPVLWAGGVTATEVSFRALDHFNETFVMSLNEDLSEPGYVQLLTSDTVWITVDALQPDTVYHYGFVDGDKGKFQTFANGRFSFKVGFGSCAATGSSSQIWEDLRKEKFHFFIHMGDLHYNNIVENNVTRYIESYKEVFDGEAQKNFYLSTPIAYMWDDHDYSDNDSGATSLSSFASGKGNIGQAFTVGGVRFIMPDLRSEAYPFHPDSEDKKGQIMSQRQMDWFLSELNEFESYSLIVVVSSRHWIGAEEEGEEPWFGFPEDRLLVANFIADKNITNLIMLAGSTHMLAFDDGSNSDYSERGGAGFPVMQAAPLDRWGSSKGGPFTHGCFSRLGDYNEQYGVLEVIDNPNSNSTCVHIVGKRVNEGGLIDWTKCTPLVKVGIPGNDTCSIDIMPPWAWIAYSFGTGTVLLLFILCMVGYVNYITSLTKKRRTMIFSLISLVSMFVLIGMFPLVRILEANTPHRPSYLPVHSAYVMMALAGIYLTVVSVTWENKYQAAPIEGGTNSDVVALSDYEDEEAENNSD